jgi:hypothetical protein
MVRALGLALLVLALVPAGARAAQPASLFNANGQDHALLCVPLASSPVPLWFPDGETQTGFTLTNDLTFNDGRCPSNTVRLDYHESFPTPVGQLVFHRGGNGYSDEQNTKYGHLATSDIGMQLPAPVPSGGGRGAPCAALTGDPHAVDVKTIPAEMHYKRPQDLPSGSNRGSSFEHYGDPGADQGADTTKHYTYLLWSFVNVRGGGIVRTLLEPGQTVRPCDVDPVTMDSWDREGNVNGSVTARYVESRVGNCRVYGWTVWTHRYSPDGPADVAHTALDATPDPRGTTDPGCPVADAAKPPTIATGDASGQQDGTATLTGTAHPEGAPTSYWFEYGPSPALGTSTPPRNLSVAMRTNNVSAALAGLQPGATYHYRIVASGEHGSSTGETRTFTVPAPPAPTPPPPPPEPVALGGLKVTPSPLRRSRNRLGTSASIRYTLTKPATVTFSFALAKRGMVVGAKCKSLPGGRLPRKRRRCTRWVAVPGALSQQARAGAGKLRFGGWIGRRALAAGRYRVTALPADGGPGATPRVAGFRIAAR